MHVPEYCLTIVHLFPLQECSLEVSRIVRLDLIQLLRIMVKSKSLFNKCMKLQLSPCGDKCQGH